MDFYRILRFLTSHVVELLTGMYYHHQQAGDDADVINKCNPFFPLLDNFLKKQCVRGSIELAEVFGTGLVGVGGIELVLVVAPDEEIVDGVFVHDGLQTGTEVFLQKGQVLTEFCVRHLKLETAPERPERLMFRSAGLNERIKIATFADRLKRSTT